MSEKFPTEALRKTRYATRPSRADNGVPYCDEQCPQYDGKRCRIMGFRPSSICEPEVLNLLSAHAATEKELEEEKRARGEAVTRICGAFGITSVLQLAAIAERDDETTIDLVVKLIGRLHARCSAAESALASEKRAREEAEKRLAEPCAGCASLEAQMEGMEDAYRDCDMERRDAVAEAERMSEGAAKNFDMMIAAEERMADAESALASEREAHAETKRTLAEEQKSHLDALSEAFAMSGAERARASALAARLSTAIDLLSEVRHGFAPGTRLREAIEAFHDRPAEDYLSRPAAGATTEHDGEEGNRG